MVQTFHVQIIAKKICNNVIFIVLLNVQWNLLITLTINIATYSQAVMTLMTSKNDKKSRNSTQDLNVGHMNHIDHRKTINYVLDLL